MHAVTLEQLEEISRKIAVRMVASSGWTCPAVALDMTNFATFIDSGNGRAPIAQRGKAKQKRTDLRLVGLGLVVTRDGGIPLTWHAYPGDRPDVTQFPAMIDQLLGPVPGGLRRGQASSGDRGHDRGLRRRAELRRPTSPTSPGTGLHYIGSVPASDCPDLTALPASAARRRRQGPVRRADRL